MDCLYLRSTRGENVLILFAGLMIIVYSIINSKKCHCVQRFLGFNVQSGPLTSVENLLSSEWLSEHYKRNAVCDVEMGTTAAQRANCKPPFSASNSGVEKGLKVETCRRMGQGRRVQAKGGGEGEFRQPMEVFRDHQNHTTGYIKCIT